MVPNALPSLTETWDTRLDGGTLSPHVARAILFFLFLVQTMFLIHILNINLGNSKMRSLQTQKIFFYTTQTFLIHE